MSSQQALSPNCPLTPLQVVFAKWKELHEAYVQADRGDPAYWASEASNCGLLATAAHMVGGRGLVEVPLNRHVPAGVSKGAVDLWLESPPPNQITFLVEAKQRLLDSASADRRTETVRCALANAEEQVRQLDRSWDQEGLVRSAAIVFALPKLTGSRPIADFAVELARSLTDCYIQSVGCEPAPVWQNNHFPGIIMVARGML